MRKITLLFSSGMIGSLINGIMGIATGSEQKISANGEENTANRQFDKAYNNISPNNDPVLTGQQNTVRRIMGGIQSGTGGGYAANSLASGVRSGASSIAGLAGGDTGAALATIDNLHNNLSDVYGKQEAQNSAYVNQLLGLDSNLSGEISQENQASNDKRAQFWKMRADQNMSRALSDRKSGVSNEQAGVSSIGTSMDDMIGGGIMGGGGGSGSGSGGGGGSSSGGGGIMSMFGGMMGGTGNGGTTGSAGSGFDGMS